jgi:hypothetical protein
VSELELANEVQRRGVFGASIADLFPRRKAHKRTRGPLAIAGFFAVAIFFASLLVATLAIDDPQTKGLRQFPSSSATEAKIWAAALIPSAILVGIGFLAVLVRRWGIYISLAAALVICLVLPLPLDTYVNRHTERFRYGADFVRDSNPANVSSRGEWEAAAKETVISMTHWTIGLIVIATVIMVAVDVRRRRRGVEPTPEPPPAGAMQVPGTGAGL